MGISHKHHVINRMFVVMTLVVCMTVQAVGCDHSSTGQSAETEPSGQTVIENLASGTVADDERFDTELFAMDTFMTMTAFGPHAPEALEKAKEEILSLEALLSTGIDDSEVTKINSSGEGIMTETVASLMETSIRLWESTEGAFNPAILPVMKLWGFTDGNFRIPEEGELAAALELLDVSLVEFDKESGKVHFAKQGMAIDFGGIAKGYASSRIMEIFADSGVNSAMVNLGGNVQTFGTKPDGKKWKIAVQDPKKEGNYLCVIESDGQAIITSGGYERYFEEGGVIYHHIIDPSDGYPADNGLTSVTIVNDDGTMADGLSTSLFVMGKDKAIDYWRSHEGEFEMVLYTDEGELLATEGLKGSLTSEKTLHYIERA